MVSFDNNGGVTTGFVSSHGHADDDPDEQPDPERPPHGFQIPNVRSGPLKCSDGPRTSALPRRLKDRVRISPLPRRRPMGRTGRASGQEGAARAGGDCPETPSRPRLAAFGPPVLPGRLRGQGGERPPKQKRPPDVSGGRSLRWAYARLAEARGLRRAQGVSDRVASVSAPRRPPYLVILATTPAPTVRPPAWAPRSPSKGVCLER